MSLNPKQELFCRYYATNEAGTFGNATNAYLEAYKDKDDDGNELTYQSAGTCAWRLLKKVEILDYLKELWKMAGIIDEEVDAHLSGIIRQDKDLKTKLGGIREYNHLRERGADVHRLDVYDKYKDES